VALVPKLAVIGHVEHVTRGRVAEVPRAGDIAHLAEPRTLAGGGGGLAFAQLVRSDAEVHFFTALGDDDGAREVRARLPSRPGVFVHAAERRAPHPRVVVMVDDGGRRTIVVTAEPLQPAASDPLPWAILADCDAAYFTGRDPASLVRARAAKTLVATARRREVIAGAGVRCDVVVGSVNDPRERAGLDAYPTPPGALVLTDGAGPIRILRDGGTTSVSAPPEVKALRSDYGAGDSFAAALVYFVARGLPVEEAARLAGPFGAAVLRGVDPIEAQASLRA
jgi:ribokinase